MSDRRLPDAGSPAVILERALARAFSGEAGTGSPQKMRPREAARPFAPEPGRGTVGEALREAVQPATIAELIVTFACLIAPAAILFFAGE